MRHYLTLLLLLSLSTGRAAPFSDIQKKQQTGTGNNFTISGICKDSAARMKPAKLLFRVYDFYSSSGFNTNLSIRTERLFFNQTFSNSFTLPAAESFMTIVNHSPKAGLTMFRIDHTYLVETGDSLHCEIFRDSIRFSGKGSERMNIQAGLFRISDKNFRIDSNLSDLKARLQKTYMQQIGYLKHNRTKITRKTYDYLFYQCYGYMAKALIRQIDYEKNYHKKQYTFEAETILAGLDQTDRKILKSKAHRSDTYMDYLYRKIKFSYQLRHPEGKQAKAILEKIGRDYKGEVRDRLYLIAFSDLPKDQFRDVFSGIDVAIASSSYRPYKEILLKYKTSSASTQPAYPFELADSTGQTVRLSDFKGRVVVMDFWFTGCMPCMALAEQMLQIVPLFKGKEVVFISVNVDSDKSLWKKSLRSGKYTHSGTINLYADAFERNAPILSYYNISAYPRLIVIDKNMRIASATPIRPSKAAGTHESFIAFISGLL